MIGGIVFLWSLAAIMTVIVMMRPDLRVKTAVTGAWDQARPLLVRMPLALMAAALIGALIPPELVALALGDASGVLGIVIASVLGGIMPGGPMVSFPLVIVMMDNGAGAPQIVALLTAWSVMAIHRVMIYELPLLGGSFVMQRIAASIVLAPIAGFLAMALV